MRQINNSNSKIPKIIKIKDYILSLYRSDTLLINLLNLIYNFVYLGYIKKSKFI